jgi:cytochrome bd-type quinol oxidase subunit 2
LRRHHAGKLHLYPGWIPGFRNDLSDIQWREYRASFPTLTAVLLVFVALSRTLRSSAGSTAGSSAGTAQHAYQIAAGVALICALHGTSAVHVLLSLVIHYALAQRTAGTAWLGPICIWAVPCTIWLAARSTNGLPFSMLSQQFAGLDGVSGMLRWYSPFNLLLLRMISWGCDLHWTRMQRGGHALSFGFGAPRLAPT